jgi:SAM-dependent methyltransferase
MRDETSSESHPAAQAKERASSQPAFWDERFADRPGLFGEAPNAFVAAAAEPLPRGAEVVELGAGDGRNLIPLGQRRGFQGTAVDFAEAGLRRAQARAQTLGVSLETVAADVRRWTPGARKWDAVIVTFVQLLPHERPSLYRLIRQLLRPGGRLIGLWFRPAHLTAPFARIGPSRGDRMVPASEVRRAFAGWPHQVTATTMDLDDGPVLQGRAAVTQAVVRCPDAA